MIAVVEFAGRHAFSLFIGVAVAGWVLWQVWKPRGVCESCKWHAATTRVLVAGDVFNVCDRCA